MHSNGDSQPGLPASQHYEAAKALHRQGRLADAERHFRAVLSAEPGHVDAMEWLGALCAQTGRFEEGIGWLREAVARNPSSARLNANLAGALGAAQNYEEAVTVYQQALTIDPHAAVACCDLGIMLARLFRDEEAVDAFQKALTLRPDLLPAWEHLGFAQSRLGQHQQALHCFERVLAAKPGQPDTHLNYGVALAEAGRHEEAVMHFRKVVALRPDDAHAFHNLGTSLSMLDCPAEALAAFERALAITPGLAEAERGIGNVLVQLGKRQEARERFERAVALAPKTAAFHRALADVKDFVQGDSQLVTLEDLARNEDSMSVKERIELHFALAKADDDLQRYGLAFEHLEKGNALKRASCVYDEEAELAAIAAIAEAFSSELIRAKRGMGDPSDVPVFIVGMPRSGTTLVEQVLASHPLVFAAGELPDFGRASACRYAGAPLPFDPIALSTADLEGIAVRYLNRILPKAPSAKRITDKLPANFRLLGLIHLALPNARIIHVRRDPMDTCFSIYTKLFLDNIGFAYDLGELGRHYRAYETLMEHWRAVIPGMVEVQYEDLVADFDNEARRVVAACGLDWDDNCRAFMNNQRSVRTASALQVRQPVYGSSVGRWRHYAEHLGPLIEALNNGGR